MIVPKVPITIGITVTFMFQSFFHFPWQSRGIFRFIFVFSQFYSVVSRNSKVHNSATSLFFFTFCCCWLLQGLVVWPRLGDPFVSLLIILLLYSFRVFHISVSWWSFTGVWETASLLKSPGFVSGFWPFLAMLSFG